MNGAVSNNRPFFYNETKKKLQRCESTGEVWAVPAGRREVRYNWLKPGVRVRLWPADTYAKYAVVRKVDYYTVTFEITGVEPGETFYKPGHRITLPWSHVNVVEEPGI